VRNLLICSAKAADLLYQLIVVKVFFVGQQGHVLGCCSEVVCHLVCENSTSFHLIEFLADSEAVVESEMDFVLLYSADSIEYLVRVVLTKQTQMQVLELHISQSCVAIGCRRQIVFNTFLDSVVVGRQHRV
jgi:hypothetical protein